MENKMFDAVVARKRSNNNLMNNHAMVQAFEAINKACESGKFTALCCIHYKTDADLVVEVLNKLGYNTQLKLSCSVWCINITW